MWIAVASTAAVAWLAYEIITAPTGYEDADGYGPIHSDQFPTFPGGHNSRPAGGEPLDHLTDAEVLAFVREVNRGGQVSHHAQGTSR
jgi:hypothetical protein